MLHIGLVENALIQIVKSMEKENPDKQIPFNCKAVMPYLSSFKFVNVKDLTLFRNTIRGKYQAVRKLSAM